MYSSATAVTFVQTKDHSCYRVLVLLVQHCEPVFSLCNLIELSIQGVNMNTHCPVNYAKWKMMVLVSGGPSSI